VAETKERKTKKIKLEIKHKEEDLGEGWSFTTYNVNLSDDSGTWDEVATSKEHLQLIIRGLNMAFGMMGVHSGIPTSLSTPFSMEITCHKGQVIKGFKLPR